MIFCTIYLTNSVDRNDKCSFFSENNSPKLNQDPQILCLNHGDEIAENVEISFGSLCQCFPCITFKCRNWWPSKMVPKVNQRRTIIPPYEARESWWPERWRCLNFCLAKLFKVSEKKSWYYYPIFFMQQKLVLINYLEVIILLSRSPIQHINKSHAFNTKFKLLCFLRNHLFSNCFETK